MRKLALVLILVGASLTAGSVFLQLKFGALNQTPAAVLELERALAQPGLMALATLNVEALLELADQKTSEAGSESGEGIRAQLSRAGIDLERDLTHVTLALSSHEDGNPRAAIALFGRFDPARIERAMREHPDLVVEAGKTDGVLRLQRIDPESCEQTGPFSVHLGSQRVLVAYADAMASLLGAPDPGDTGQRDLSRFQAFRGGQLVSAAFFVPEELPTADNMFVALATQSAAQHIDGFRAFYAGASPQILPPGLAIDLLFEAVDADVTEKKAADWQAAIEGVSEGFGEKLPTLARILDALEIHAEGAELFAQLHLAKSDLEQLQELPGEIGSSLFGGSMLISSGEELAEQLDDSPLAFLAQTSREALAPYDPNVAFAGAAESTAGPVGVRLSALRLRPSDGRSELEIEAFSTGVPNLGDRGERVSIQVTSALGKGAQELLAEEHCGADRNDQPAALAQSFGGGLLTGTKTVRIRDGAAPDDVARIRGRVTIRLPVRTERVRLPAKPGAMAKRAGTQIEITKADGGSFSYKVSGKADSLLHLRALNAAGKPLARRGSSSGSSMFGNGSSGSAQFAGAVHEVEAVFALEEELLHYPFELVDLRPGTDGEQLAPKSPSGERAPALTALAGSLENWLEQMAGSVAQKIENVVDGSDEPLAVTRSGPFRVSLEAVWSFGGLMPRLEVQAPEIPGVADSPTAVELRIDELRMLDGSVHAGAWSEILEMGQGFGRPGLVGSAQLQTGVQGSADDLASLHGSLLIRLPERVSTRRFASAELGAGVEAPGLSVQLVELARDRFTLRASRGARRVLGARAFNGFGEELWIPHRSVEWGEDGTLTLHFQVTGIPAQIELRYAEKLTRAEYPFVLTKNGQKLARNAP